MASSVIHMAVANEVNKIIKRDLDKILIGSIAPDISKHIGKTKEESHFLIDHNSDIPDISRFLKKYQRNLNDDFVMGYFIHLYTYYLWFNYFLKEIYNEDTNMITKLDGTEFKCKGNMLSLYIYNDYTNLNLRLLEKYNMDLHIFYNAVPKFKNIIDEIPMDEINIIINATKDIIENTKVHKDLVFDITNIINFIELSTKLIIAELKEIGYFEA